MLFHGMLLMAEWKVNATESGENSTKCLTQKQEDSEAGMIGSILRGLKRRWSPSASAHAEELPCIFNRKARRGDAKIAKGLSEFPIIFGIWFCALCAFLANFAVKFFKNTRYLMETALGKK